MTYQEKFRAFLANAMKFRSEAIRDRIVADAEGPMTDFIRAEIDPNFALYAVEGAAATGDWYLDIRQKLTTRPSWTAGRDIVRLKAALTSYADFVKSKAFRPDKARLAAGERTLPKPAAKKTAKGAGGAPANGATLPVVLEEGEIRKLQISKCERNPALRRACIAYGQAQNGGRIACAACGMSFGDVYGEIGDGYIEVHHLSPISQTGGRRHKVDPTTDLVPLCANCHAMIHRLMASERNADGTALEGAAALATLKARLAERKGGR